ncbi:MAG: hypothetical protein ACQCN3_15765 [Candidatus Bathyarchaeia archaeon]
MTSKRQLIKHCGAPFLSAYQACLLQLVKVVGYVLFAPAIRAPDFGGVVSDLDSFEYWYDACADGSKVKFDF